MSKLPRNRAAYLQAMGVVLYARRTTPVASQQCLAAEQQQATANQASTRRAVAPPPDESSLPLPADRQSPMTHASGPADRQGLSMQGQNCAPVTGDKTPKKQVTSPKASNPQWLSLQEQVGQCVRCPELVKQRSQTVFGVGNPDADWLFIGEAPGVEEDRRGEPFVGRAGQLLNRMLHAMGLQREEVYIANVIKCRPPQNRNPAPSEISNCATYLRTQIDLIAPKIIVALGAVAAHALLLRESALKELRGIRHVYANTQIPLIVTYHPAYLLRAPAQKKNAWEDLQLAMKVLSDQLS